MNENNTTSPLFPPIEPFATHMLEVGDGHTLYVEQCGNPHGLPVVVLHGGPGSGCSPKSRQRFDPTLYHIVCFDQRGCGRSVPLGKLEANTTQHLMTDIETIRQLVGVESWVVYGTSWGSTLALAYAQAYPERVRGIVTGAVFTGTEDELAWFYQPDGLARFFPEEYNALFDLLHLEDRSRIFHALEERLAPDTAEAEHLARTTFLLDAMSMILTPQREEIEAYMATPEFHKQTVRLWAHYFAQRCFLTPHQLFKDLPRMAHLPITILQGELDLCCPQGTARKLHAALPGSTYVSIPLCGHLPNDAMEAARVEATTAMAKRLGF